jgi:signal transduction histidine kinase
VIITDIHMPNMTGLELCHLVRTKLKFKNLPILVMTTDNDYDTVAKVFKAGATDFISKPINELELVSRVRRILEQRTTEKELYIAQNAAQLATTRKSQFLASVNHELKNPLNGVYGFAQMLHELEVDEKKKSMLEVLVRGSEQMTSMINQLLELDKIEGGYAQMDVQCLKLAEVLKRCVEINQPLLAQKEVTLSQNVGSELVVNTDEKMLFSVLSNLLSNAIKYNKIGGKILIKGYKINQLVQLDIKDNGIGMSKEQLSQIFDPFTRFIGKGQRAEGHGLGMAITKSSVDAMGIEMSINSELDKGTTVSLIIG